MKFERLYLWRPSAPSLQVIAQLNVSSQKIENTILNRESPDDSRFTSIFAIFPRSDNLLGLPWISHQRRGHKIFSTSLPFMGRGVPVFSVLGATSQYV
jgi:hypothetical protein